MKYFYIIYTFIYLIISLIIIGYVNHLLGYGYTLKGIIGWIAGSLIGFLISKVIMNRKAKHD